MRILVLTFILIASAAAAQDWREPARGTAERKALMDAIRRPAEDLFGPPVQFVVGRLRVAGDRAFAMVSAQRPGGGEIDIEATPGWAADYFLEDADWFGGQAFLRRAGREWRIDQVYFGATEVWWDHDPVLCRDYRAVIPESCR